MAIHLQLIALKRIRKYSILGLLLVSHLCFCIPLVFASHFADGIETYKRNLMPEHKLKLADDIKRYHSADNLWDVLRDEFSLPHYEDNPVVHEKINWYLNNQVYLLRSATRAAPFLYYILQQVKKRHLPAEIVLLPILESGYDPFSLSNAGAAGIWQLMPDTATGLGIRQDWWYDGRRDIIASTHAALVYLEYLRNFFDGKWLLALAAYNTGEGNVASAIKRNIRRGKNTDFWSLPVAQQTRDYVPSLLALAAIISNPDRYPVYLPPVKNAPYLAQVDIGSQINLKYAATLAGMSFKALKRLNPGFNHSSISGKGPYRLILPIETVAQFTENLLKNPFATEINWTKYKIRAGDTLISIARKFQVSVITLRVINELKSHLLHPGTILLVPTPDDKKPKSPLLADNSRAGNKGTERSAKASVRATLAQDSIHDDDSMLQKLKAHHFFAKAKYRLTPGDTLYLVRNNDTLVSIAKKFHVDATLIQNVNQLTTTTLKLGEHLIIPTHVSNPSSKVNLMPGDTLYIVRNGDTIETIANRFHTTAAALRLANLMNTNSIEIGEKLVVPTHLQG